MAKEQNAPQIIEADCPSCGVRSSFRYLGKQSWPQEVAAHLGVPAEIALYQCESCLTTVSAPSLLSEK